MNGLSVHPRVLIVVDSLQITGPSRLVVSSAVGLSKRGLDVHVAHLGIGDGRALDAELRANGMPVVNLRIDGLLHPRPVVGLAKYVRRNAIDVVHTHNPYAHLVGRPAAWLARRPSISTVHSIVDTESGWRVGLRRRLDYMSARRMCRLVLTVSDAQRAVYVREARIAPSHVERYWNGVDTRVFRPDADSRRRCRVALGMSPDQPVFITVAALRAGKGLEDLLEAVPLVLHEAPEARFVIVGDGPLWSALTATIAWKGLGQAVTLLGQRAEVSALLAAADVYVHPSHFEALPTSVLEAMAAGLPVLACEVGGVPEIVHHQRTGLLVPPQCPDLLAEGMLQLMTTDSRRGFGAAGRAWVEGHASLDRWLDDLQSVYERVRN